MRGGGYGGYCDCGPDGMWSPTSTRCQRCGGQLHSRENESRVRVLKNERDLRQLQEQLASAKKSQPLAMGAFDRAGEDWDAAKFRDMADKLGVSVASFANLITQPISPPPTIKAPTTIKAPKFERRFRWRLRQAGQHVHVRLFVIDANENAARIGELTFGAIEWRLMHHGLTKTNEMFGAELHLFVDESSKQTIEELKAAMVPLKPFDDETCERCSRPRGDCEC